MGYTTSKKLLTTLAVVLFQKLARKTELVENLIGNRTNFFSNDENHASLRYKMALVTLFLIRWALRALVTVDKLL